MPFMRLKGSHNIALGVNAGKLTTAGDSDIYIGHPGLNGSESKVTRIGQSQTKTFIAGIKGVPLSGATVVVNAAGQLGVVASSARYKKDIKPLARHRGQAREAASGFLPLQDRARRHALRPDRGRSRQGDAGAGRARRKEPAGVGAVSGAHSAVAAAMEGAAARLIAREEAENARQRALIDAADGCRGQLARKLRRALATRLATLDGVARKVAASNRGTRS